MFIQSCFVRKNTPELIKKLEELGYNRHPSYGDNGQYLYLNRGFYHTNVVGYSEEIERMIDCGTNEELFLALAALRDDSDYMQWFICDDNESMFKVDKPDMSMSKFIHEYMDGWNVSGARKATVKEIIEHFK